MKKHINRRGLRAAGAAAAALIVIAVIVSAVRSARLRALENSYTSQGEAYLRALESQDLSTVKASIREKQTDNKKASVEELLAKIDSGEADLWACFDDAVILGDSRGDDFQYNGFLPKSKILCDLGASCGKALDYLDTVASMAPKQIIFTYGMNDVDGNFSSADAFTAEYLKVINEFRAKLPDSEYYVNSIIPVTEHAIENDSNYENIPAYNEALKQMCAANDLVWIDCDDLLSGHEDLYDTDGQHFLKDAYPLWGRRIIRSIYEYENGISTESGAVSAAEAVETADSAAETPEGESGDE